MAILVSDVQLAGNYFRRSTETADFTAAKSLEAVALAIEDVHSYALYRFTQRVQRFDYLDGQSDYIIADDATNFKASIQAPDFRAIKDLRLSIDHDDDFDLVSPNEFAIAYGEGSSQKVYTIEQRDGANVLRINQPDIGSSTTLHSANDFDSNGTWAVGNDASNIGTDTVVFIANSGSISFDVSGATTTASISVSDMTAVDISAYQGTGLIRLWLYIPEVTDDTSQYVTSVEFRWGNDSSNYWSQTVNKPANNAVFQDRWNQLEFNWRDATETGTVTETAVDYLAVIITYGSGQAADTGFRVNDIKIYNPKEMKMVYFSNFTVAITSSLIWKLRATATTDILLAPDVYKNVYVDAFNWYTAQFLYPIDHPRVKAYELKYRGQYDARHKKWVGGSLERLIRQEGERYKMKQTKLKPQISFD